MKRVCMLLSALALCCIMLLSLVGCAVDVPRGITGAQINASGELVLTYSDGTKDNLGVIVGEDGQPGADGAVGESGSDGQDGVITIVDADGTVALATAKGLRSAVKISCGFTKTVQSSVGGYYPNSGSNTYSYTSSGAGVIYTMDKTSGDAFIITNYHVVYDTGSNTENGISENISVYLYGAESDAISATYVGGSMTYDIAVLHITDSALIRNGDYTAVSVADSDEVSVGESAIAIGNPESLGISATYGVVSVDSEYIEMTAADGKTTVSFRVMRIDTAVNSGNSGGGLFNSEGELIGIVNAKLNDSSVENIGYAIPSDIARAVADNIIDNCYGTASTSVLRGTLGVGVKAVSLGMRYDETTGLIDIYEQVVVKSVDGGGAADGGLAVDDIIIGASIGERSIEVSRLHHVIDLMLDARVGDTVVFTVLRDGSELEVEIVLDSADFVEYQ